MRQTVTRIDRLRSANIAGPQHGTIGWTFVGFLCWLYNAIAGRVGGIVVDLSPAGGL